MCTQKRTIKLYSGLKSDDGFFEMSRQVHHHSHHFLHRFLTETSNCDNTMDRTSKLSLFLIGTHNFNRAHMSFVSITNVISKSGSNII